VTEPAPLRGPRIRRAPIPANVLFLVRGKEPTPAIARDRAVRFRRRFPDWGRYGLSAFYARDDTEIEDLAANQLRRFPILELLRPAGLTAAGFELVPTFRTPHVTIAFSGGLDERLATLESLDVDRRTNPYHDQRPGSGEDGRR
jgi:hypothetical protein